MCSQNFLHTKDPNPLSTSRLKTHGIYVLSIKPLKTLKRDRESIGIVGLPMETQSRFLKQTENIPEEIILEILSRLPVKSLLRFRCICKVWKSLIGDPKFTLSFPRPNQKIAIKSGKVYSIDAKHGLSRDPLLKQMLFFDDEKATKRLNILGSCNGLFLVSHYTDLYLWNPSTRESTKVLSLRTKGWPKDFSFRAYASGLCYDSSADDYKAVLAKDFGKANVVSFKRKYGTTTTFSAGETDDRSTATFYTDENDDRYELLYGTVVNGPVVNEKLHWAITSYRHYIYYACFPIRNQNERSNHVLRVTTRSRIVSFNPLTDKFEEFPMPLLANNGEAEPIIKGLGVLDGYLCMTRCVNRGSGGDEVGPGFFELLVMQEYGVGGSWTRILNVSNDFEVLSRGDLVPLCSTSDGEVVISSTHLKKICAFNLEDMSQREIIMPSEGAITYQTSYAESLISPAAYGHEEDWIVKSLDKLKRKRPKSSLISQRVNKRSSRKSQQSDTHKKDQTEKEMVKKS